MDTFGDKSIWFKIVVIVTFIDSLCSLYVNLFVGLFGLYVCYKLLCSNKLWRNFSAYIRVPLGVIGGIVSINEYDYTGEFMLLECAIFAIALIMSRKEFNN